MMKNKIFIPITIIVLAFVVVYGIYVFYFDFSLNKGDLGTFGDYLSGTLNPIISFAVFYYVAKTYQAQSDYSKQQEFDNHFFKLLEDFTYLSSELKQQHIFSDFIKELETSNITDKSQFSQIINHINYPKNYFLYLNTILHHINNSHLDTSIKQNYMNIVKLKLENVNLVFIALNDTSQNNQSSQLYIQYKLFENINFANDDILVTQLILAEYNPLFDYLPKENFTQKSE